MCNFITVRNYASWHFQRTNSDVLLFVMQYTVVLTFTSMDELLKYEKSRINHDQ